MKKSVLSLAVISALGIGVFLSMRYTERAHQEENARTAMLALRAVADTFYKAEGSELPFDLSQANAETAVSAFASVAKTKAELQLLDVLQSKLYESASCRRIMTAASIESLRINEPCFKQGERLLNSGMKDVKEVEEGKADL